MTHNRARLGFLAASAFLLGLSNGAVASPYGTLLGYLNNVKIYSNGSPKYVSNSYNYSTYNGKSYRTGMKWQCVEFARRYYLLRYGRFLSYTGNANTWWSNGAGLKKYKQGGTIPPRAGDIICSNSGSFGHLAVVRSVGTGYITISQQNFFEDSRDVSYRLSLVKTSTGRYYVAAQGGYAWAGWLRR